MTETPGAPTTPEVEPTAETPLEIGDHIAAPANVAEVPPSATRTLSGLAFAILREPAAESRRATPTSTVTAHYSGWTTDGALFDSSWQRGEPATFPLTKVIKGWQEGVGSMAEGEIRRLWIPEDLAYAGRADRPMGMLVFDVELIRVED